jgi:hypothetical protein
MKAYWETRWICKKCDRSNHTIITGTELSAAGHLPLQFIFNDRGGCKCRWSHPSLAEEETQTIVCPDGRMFVFDEEEIV